MTRLLLVKKASASRRSALYGESGATGVGGGKKTGITFRRKGNGVLTPERQAEEKEST